MRYEKRIKEAVDIVKKHYPNVIVEYEPRAKRITSTYIVINHHIIFSRVIDELKQQGYNFYTGITEIKNKPKLFIAIKEY